MKAIIIGLGNPGIRYRDTRHNIGWMVVDGLASTYNIRINREGKIYIYGKGNIEGEEVIILKPQTYMNNSGRAAREVLRKMRLQTKDMIVVHDDIDMGLGKIRIKKRGGHGGHNGIRSIIEHLGRDDFVRVKIGIGRQKGIPPSEFVLSRFEPYELPSVEEAINRARDEVVGLLSKR